MKRSFTLIEVLIGCALAALVLGMLFSSLYETSLMSSRLKSAEQDILSRAQMQQRLDSVLASLAPSEERKTSLFLIEEEDKPPVLQWVYLSGIDPDPHFSGEVTAFLVLENNHLILRVKGNTFSPKENISDRVEILKSNVKQIDYEFLSKGEVFSTWEKIQAAPPDYLKLTLTLDANQKESYVFWINKKPEGVLFL